MIKTLNEIVVRALWDSQEDLSDYNWFISDEIYWNAQIIDIHKGYVILGFLKTMPEQFELPL